MKPIFVLLLLATAWLGAGAQEAIRLHSAPPSSQPDEQPFAFASDGPIGPGWTRPDQIARVYVSDMLPTLFRRTIRLDTDVPNRTTLSWIFTGPHAGITVDLTSTKVKLSERSYANIGLLAPGTGPNQILSEQERPYTGNARELTVVVDAHLAVSVLLNGEVLLWQSLVFDLTRQQLMFSGPRNEHLMLSGALLKEPVRETNVVVVPDKIHQTMIGFGGSPSVPAYAALSPAGKDEYWRWLRRYNLLVDREYPMGTQLRPDLSNVEDLREATPHYYGDNFPNGEVSDFDYSRKARALGGEVLYEMWALPSWAVQAYTPKGAPIVDAWGKPVKTAAKPDVYARIVVDFCRRAKEGSGAAPEIIGIQNEVEQAPEIYAAMTTAVRRALDAAGFQATKIQMADAPYAWMATSRVKDLRQSADAWRETDFVAAHQYDYQEFLANPDLYDQRLRALHQESQGKPFLATEICLNDGKYQEASYRLALQVGQLYHKDLTEVDAEMLLYCWLLLDVEQPNFGASRSLMVPDRSLGQVPVPSSFQMRVLGAYSRHVLKGMHRVEANTSNPDLLTAAFTDGKQSTVVVLNRSTAPQKLKVTWPGVRWTVLDRASFYAENTEAGVPDSLIVAPGEIVTISTVAGAR